MTRRTQIEVALVLVGLPLFILGWQLTVALYLSWVLVVGLKKWLRSVEEPPTQLPGLESEFDPVTLAPLPPSIAAVHREMDREAFLLHDVGVEQGLQCPYCRDSLSGRAALCTGCDTSLHPECLDETEGCTTLGCRARPRRLAS